MLSETLNEQIKKQTLKGVYIFEGPEEYLKEQAVESIRESLIPSGFEALNETLLYAPSIDEIFDCAQVLPFMSDKRLVVAKDPPFMFSRQKDDDGSEKAKEKKEKDKKAKDELSEKLNDLNQNNETCVVILYLRSGAAKEGARRLNPLSEDKAVRFDFSDPLTLRKWTKDICAKKGVPIAEDAADELALSCSRSRNAIIRELEKLFAYKGYGGKIALDDVRALVTPSVETSVFKMIDAQIAGNNDAAYSILEAMLTDNTSPAYILSMVTRQLRLMCHVKTMLSAKASYVEIQKSLDLKHDFQVRSYASQASNVSLKRLTDLYSKSVDKEFLFKSGKIGERQALDEMMVLLNEISKKPGTKASPYATNVSR